MERLFRRATLFTAAFALSLALISTSFAQDLDEVSISGKIVDSDGSSILNASVTATLTDTGIERTVTTDENGRYRIIELAPGRYSIKVSADGFGAKIKTNLQTLSGQNVRLDFALDPAAVVVDPVEVSDENAPIIDITRTVVGGTITEKEIEDLPNSSNDVLDLVYTLAGVAEEPFSIRDLSDDRIGGGNSRDQPSEVLGAGIFSLSGGAAYSTNITIDGLDDNDDGAAEERFQPPVDSVAEVQVVSNQFSAEYGRASGGRVNIRTKSGARKFRGRAYLFFEDDNFNANSYNNNRRNLSRLPFTEYTPGVTFGGPVPLWYFKNKTFFFSSYEYQNRNADTLIDSALPVDQNSRYPLSTPTDLGTRRVDEIPARTDNFATVDIASYVARIGTPTRRQRFTQRIDHNFADNHNVTLNYQLGRSDNFRQYRETTRFLEETLQGRIKSNDSFYITDNYVFNSNLVNQIRFQYSNFRPDFATDGAQNPVVVLAISDDSRAGRDDQIRGDVVIGNSTANFASLREETRYQFQETLNYLAGNHSLRFGADVQLIKSDNTDLSDSTGTYDFLRVADFLTNQPSRYRRNFGTTSTQKNNYYSLFVQDDWRVRPNLTLSFGLRYERETIVRDKNNFGPRLALAYSPGKGGKSVIRIGGGIFYNRALLRTLDDYSLGAQTLEFDSENLAGPSSEDRCLNQPTPQNVATDKCRFLIALGRGFPNAPTLANLKSTLNSLNIDGGFTTEANFTRLIESNIKIPESYQFNVGYERDLGGSFAFETNFTYNKAARLWRETNINAYQVPEGFANFTDYLISLGTININGRNRTFVLGDAGDPVGTFNPDSRNPNRINCTLTTRNCIINLRSSNPSQAQSSPIGFAFAALEENLTRPFNDDLEQVEMVSAIGQSVYEGLSLELHRRFKPLGYGFKSSFRIVYVLSRTRDDGFVDTSSAQIPGDFKTEFGFSGIDRRHKFRFSGTLEMPKWLGKITLSPLLRLESGRPFNISIGGKDRNLDDLINDRPNYTGSLSDIVSRKPGDPFPRRLADNFSLPAIGTPGNLPRNAGRGPALFIFNAKFSRRFKFREHFSIRPEATVNNILNARVFSFGSDFIDLSTIGTTEFAQGFLTPSRTLSSRQIQFGIRFEF